MTKAIEETNLVAPETLDNHREVFFRLNTQRLIEFIRQGNISGALDFARAELADLAEENQQFLDWLEEAMALLAFPERERCGACLCLCCFCFHVLHNQHLTL